MGVTDRLREAMKASGIPQAELARVSGVHEAVLSRFRRGETALGGENLDRLADALGLELVQRKAAKGKTAKQRSN